MGEAAEAAAEAEAEAEEVVVEEADQPNPQQPNQQSPKEMGNWKEKNPPYSRETGRKPTSSCMNSNSTSSSTPPHQSWSTHTEKSHTRSHSYKELLSLNGSVA